MNDLEFIKLLLIIILSMGLAIVYQLRRISAILEDMPGNKKF